MRTVQGTVVSTKMQKTIVVRVDRLKKHPKYGKYYRVSGKFKAHDEKGEYRSGDIVLLEETRPLSRDKRWRVASLVKRPAEVEPENQQEAQ
ncbi:MAG: 30S ribosomal protein S17 [Candidatus Sungbacteria bacterium]|nr:30S ribosomal protein S17 [Candidatus Sungbacteria bacterium]